MTIDRLETPRMHSCSVVCEVGIYLQRISHGYIYQHIILRLPACIVPNEILQDTIHILSYRQYTVRTPSPDRYFSSATTARYHQTSSFPPMSRSYMPLY